jgi:phage major head subunit gpT-like protein
MDINRANMDIFFTECMTAFSDGMNARRDNLILAKVGMQMPSTTAVAVHGWLSQIPSMRKWVGERQARNLKSGKLSVTNAKFENTIEITREEFEDDMHRLYLPTFGLMGQDALAMKDRCLVDALLQNGNWADAAAFFGDSRVYGSATIDNYDTTAYSEDGAALNTAFTKMTSYLGDGGVPLMVRPYAILHGPALRTKVQKSLSAYGALLASATQVGGMIVNPNANIVTPIESPYLINGYVDMDGNSYANAGTYWFLLGEVGGIKGLIYQSRIEPEMQDARARLDSDFAFQNDKIQWGVRARGAGFLSLPHLIYGSFATT